jgi:uridine kinase
VLARYVAKQLASPVLSLDSYYRDLGAIPLDQRGARNFDTPDALDHELFVAGLREYVAGKPLQVPVYDFKTHSRTAQIETIAPGRFLIVEGLFALTWADARALMKTKVYVEAGEVCLQRRIERDIRERGRTRESVLEQYAQTVRPMAELHVWPAKVYADLIISGESPIAQGAAAVLEHVRSLDPSRLTRVVSV